MNLLEKYGPWACVIGAAEGLGKAFSKQLAQRGFNVIMIDKQKVLLEESAQEIRNSFDVDTYQLAIDLNDESCVDLIFKALKQRDCRFMVYNAAYGPVKPFTSNESDEIDLYLNVNARSLIQLVHRIVNEMSSKDVGILLISSLAGLRGTQFVVPYGATKAFIWNLAEGLHYEFRGSGLSVSVCCAGTIDTPNYRATKPRSLPGIPKPMAPEAVAEESLRKFGKKLFIIPGRFNKLVHFVLQRLLPRRIASTIHNDSMKKMYS